VRHVDPWDAWPNRNIVRHCACVIASQFWTAPSDHERLLRRRKHGAAAKAADGFGGMQKLTTGSCCFGCGMSTARLPGRSCLAFGASDLQLINRENHVAKCAGEASDIGAVINEKQFRKVYGYVEEGLNRREARVVIGGLLPKGRAA
jgi:hypothetical protein